MRFSLHLYKSENLANIVEATFFQLSRKNILCKLVNEFEKESCPLEKNAIVTPKEVRFWEL